MFLDATIYAQPLRLAFKSTRLKQCDASISDTPKSNFNSNEGGGRGLVDTMHETATNLKFLDEILYIDLSMHSYSKDILHVKFL